MVTIDPKLIPTLVYPQKQVKTDNQEEQSSQETLENSTPASTTLQSKETSSDVLTHDEPEGQPFKRIEMMEPWMFTPEYLEVDYNTCSTIFLRSPLPTPDRMEIPSPYPPLWHQLSYDWYANIVRSGRKNKTKKPLVINSSLVNLKPKLVAFLLIFLMQEISMMDLNLEHWVNFTLALYYPLKLILICFMALHIKELHLRQVLQLHYQKRAVM